MGLPNMVAEATNRKFVKHDPIPELYREMTRINYITGNSEPHRDTMRMDALGARSAAIQEMIMSTPAGSVEGVARQLQLAGSFLNNMSMDGDEITITGRFGVQLWIAIYGALNLLLPQCPTVSEDGFYDWATKDQYPEQAIGLFCRLLAGDYGEPAIATGKGGEA